MREACGAAFLPFTERSRCRGSISGFLWGGKACKALEDDLLVMIFAKQFESANISGHAADPNTP
ncbi:hypothetical protein CO667_24950 [Rhizobium sp. L43]|nr:hypothetical protein CO667_24950 [Rhizobium sp. L43]